MKKFCNLTILIFLTLIINGCVTHNVQSGIDFDLNLVDKVKIGKTTQSEVTQFFGEPFEKKITKANDEEYKYMFLNVDGEFQSFLVVSRMKIQKYRKDLYITFRNKIVSEIEYYVQGPLKLENPDQTFGFEGYTVQPPQGENWYVTFRTNSGIIFAKETTAGEKHSVLALVTLEEAETYIQSIEDLEVVVDRMMYKDKNSSRYKNYTHDKQKVSFREFTGFKIESKSNDHAKHGDLAVPYKLDATSFYLIHPSIPKNKYINIGYSQRYAGIITPIDLKNEVTRFIDSFNSSPN